MILTILKTLKNSTEIMSYPELGGSKIRGAALHRLVLSDGAGGPAGS